MKKTGGLHNLRVRTDPSRNRNVAIVVNSCRLIIWGPCAINRMLKPFTTAHKGLLATVHLEVVNNRIPLNTYTKIYTDIFQNQ